MSSIDSNKSINNEDILRALSDCTECSVGGCAKKYVFRAGEAFFEDSGDLGGQGEMCFTCLGHAMKATGDYSHPDSWESKGVHSLWTKKYGVDTPSRFIKFSFRRIDFV